jgi:hypothetical protein
MQERAVSPRNLLMHVIVAWVFVLAMTAVACNGTSESTGRGDLNGPKVSVEVASIQYSYDGYWGVFDIASSAKALSPRGTVVAEARVTTPVKSGPISSLDVEEIIYRGDGSGEVVATGSIRFDAHGRVISYRSTSGLRAPIFDRWQLGGP